MQIMQRSTSLSSSSSRVAIYLNQSQIAGATRYKQYHIRIGDAVGSSFILCLLWMSMFMCARHTTQQLPCLQSIMYSRNSI